MCAWAPPSGWSLLLRAASFPSRAQWCHIRFLWAPLAGWFCYYKLSIFMVVVEFWNFMVVPLSVPWFHTVSHPSGNKALILYLWQCSVSKDISGSCGYGRTRRESWDSVWSTWITADHQLGIDYQSIDYWLSINDLWLHVDYQLINC